MEYGRRLRQLLAYFFVFMLSAELPGRVFDLAQHLIWRGPGFAAASLEHAVQLVAMAAALVCALYLAQPRLGEHRLVASFPPTEPVSLALHGLGLLSGLLTVLLRR
ncbi:MAG: hypothetical protein WCK64_03620 [Synechococcaceae cyanobacterium ELA445]